MTETSKWTFNLQTLVLIGGIAATLIAWGYTLSELQSDTDRNTAAVDTLAIRLEKNDSATQQLDLRVETLEKVATDAAALRREVDIIIGQYKSDIAVIKEILQRIEKDQKRQ